MDISFYASNIQPYGTPNGTKFANKNGNDIARLAQQIQMVRFRRKKRKTPNTTSLFKLRSRC